MLELITLGLFLTIYTKKYWIKIGGEIISYFKRKISFIFGYGLLFFGLIMLIVGVISGEELTWSEAGIVFFSIPY